MSRLREQERGGRETGVWPVCVMNRDRIKERYEGEETGEERGRKRERKTKIKMDGEIEEVQMLKVFYVQTGWFKRFEQKLFEPNILI